ncbi:MAG: hypothetical protein WCF43_12040 [Steroidobacteraceae bacterium]
MSILQWYVNDGTYCSGRMTPALPQKKHEVVVKTSLDHAQRAPLNVAR